MFSANLPPFSSAARARYVEVPVGYGLQLLFLGQVVTGPQASGSALIVAACLAHTALSARAAAPRPAEPPAALKPEHVIVGEEAIALDI